MPQLLPLSRAARLVGVSRGELQKRIRADQLQTFEGQVRVSDLMRVFPDVQLEDSTQIERVRHIRESAVPRFDDEVELPPAEVLAQRLTSLSKDLTEARMEVASYADMVEELRGRIEALDDEAAAGLVRWLDDALENREQPSARRAEILSRDTFLRLISAHVKLLPSGREFLLNGKETILEAALKAGASPRYGCTSGACGSCKARLVGGEILKVREHRYTISRTEQNLGYFLMCSCTAVSDVTVEAGEARAPADIPEQRIRAAVKRITALGEGVKALFLRTPQDKRLRFLAGQSVRLSAEGLEPVELPLASCPCDGQYLEFHLHSAGRSGLHEALFSRAITPGYSMEVVGPEGDFALADVHDEAMILLSHGVGFGPIKSIVENAIAVEEVPAIHLHCMTDPGDSPYMENRCRSWSDALDRLSYTLGELDLTLDVEERLAALEVLMDDLPTLAESQLYAAGPPAFVETVEALVARHELDGARVRTLVVHTQ
ncbi:MAG: 2Fe-2S iron-sulfur cluster-binding protein [Gammaproteobacteria bacterium]